MDNSTAFWSIIFPTLLPFILIIVFFLLWRVIKWLERRKWKPITARVLHIEAIDKKDSDGVLEPRKYKLDLVFQWQGIDWYRSWIFPRIYDLPKVGDILQLRYHPKKEDFRLVMSAAEKREYRHARMVTWLFLVMIVTLPVLISLACSHLPQGFSLSEMSLCLFCAVLYLVIFLIRRFVGTHRSRRKIELGELRPITAQVHGFRKDSEGDVHAFCVVRVNGEEKEVTLPIIHVKRYEIGQWVTLYLNPETGDVLALPRMDTNG